jgi:lipid-binding SYLF domain-containing protein
MFLKIITEVQRPMKKLTGMILAIAIASVSATAFGWDPGEAAEQEAKAQEAIAALKEKDPSIQRFFDAAAGYVVIPTVGKGGIGIGGARGKGLLYENGEATAVVTLTQLTIGLQWGGQAYSEFIFFENAESMDDFKRGNYELGAQVSAVAATLGASADANYTKGVAVFTQAKGGLMYEASVGGQKFKVDPR